MGLWKRWFGGAAPPGRKQPPPAAAAETLDTDDLIEELRAEGPSARAGDVDVDASPKQVCRYVFTRLVAGTPAATLRQDLEQRGFTAKVADAYITLIQQTLFKGR